MQNFAVEGLPKGKALSAPTAANSVAMALTGLSLSDVKPASAFQSTPPAAHATFKTFDGLVVDVDGWVQDQKHYVALRPSFDAAQAERFKVATAPAAEKEGREARRRRKRRRPKPAAPDVAEDAKKVADKVTGWVYEIPDYKYESLFKPVDQLVGSQGTVTVQVEASASTSFFGSTTTRVPLQRSCHASRSRSIQIQK